MYLAYATLPYRLIILKVRMSDFLNKRKPELALYDKYYDETMQNEHRADASFIRASSGSITRSSITFFTLP